MRVVRIYRFIWSAVFPESTIVRVFGAALIMALAIPRDPENGRTSPSQLHGYQRFPLPQRPFGILLRRTHAATRGALVKRPEWTVRGGPQGGYAMLGNNRSETGPDASR